MSKIKKITATQVTDGECVYTNIQQLNSGCRSFLVCFALPFFLFLIVTCGDVLGSPQSLIYGQVLEDQYGRALPDARVELRRSAPSVSAQVSSAHTNASGEYQIASPGGAAILHIAAPGYSEVFRSVASSTKGVVRVSDVRLSRRVESPAFDFRIGTRLDLVPDKAELQIPPGAFTKQVAFSVTQLSPQALPAPLPLGWSPIWSFELHAGSRVLNIPLQLHLKVLSDPRYVLASFESDTQQWLRLKRMKPDGADTGLAFSLSKLGVVALLRADPPPFAPPVPEMGHVLQGVKPAVIPESLKASIKPSPEALFLQDSQVVVARVELDNTAKLPSGTIVGIEFSEFYQFQDGTVLLPESRLQDYVMYLSGEKLAGEVRASPVTTSIPVAELSDGGITLHVRHPDVLNKSKVLGPKGGRVKGTGGYSLDIPANALSQNVPVRLWTVSDPPLLPDHEYETLDGFMLDLAGIQMEKPARFIFSKSPKLKKSAQLLVCKTIHDRDRSYYQLVAMPSSPAQEKALGLPGIRTEGQYYLLRTRGPVGFARIRLKSASKSVGKILFHALNTRMAGIADDTDGEVVIPLMPGDHRLVARQSGTGLKGAANVQLKHAAQVVSVEMPFKRMPLTVMTVVPGEGEENVSTGSAVSMQFSEVLDSKLFKPASVKLYVGKERVEGHVEMLANGKALLFRPAQLLREHASHRLEIAAGMLDQYGNRMAGNQSDSSFISHFTTQDNTPPEPPDAGKIIAGTPDKNGIALISGTQGTVEESVLVTVRNTRTGVLASSTAAKDGSFSVTIKAGLIDNLEMLLLDEGGNEQVLDIGRVIPPPGTAVLNEAGGSVLGLKGTAAVIPKGLIGTDTIVRAEPIDTRDMVNPFSRDMPGFIAGAMKFDVSGFEVADLLEMTLSIDGYPSYTTRDSIPLFRIDRELQIPPDLVPGSTLTVRLKARDQAHQNAEISAEIKIVSNAAQQNSQTEIFDGAPSLKMVLPQQASPGQVIKILARGDPPNIKFHFPASPILTGDEQFLLFEVRDVNGKIFWDLADRGELKTLDDGSRVIQTTSPPYRGIRRDTSQLVMAVFASSALAYVQVVNSVMGAESVGVKDATQAVAGSLDAFNGLLALGTSLQSLTSWPDRNPHEFSVIPVRAGMPTTISVFSEDANSREYSMDIPAMPPGSFSEVLVLGEDDNDLQVTGVTSPANHAVPVDATLAVSFSHLIEPGSINENSLKILNTSGVEIPAKRDTNLNKDKTAYIATIKPKQPFDPDMAYTLIATPAIKRVGQGLDRGTGLKADFSFRFTTGGGLKLVGKVDLPWAKSFDVADDILLVSQREPQQGVNQFVTVDASKITEPKVLKKTLLNLKRYGPIWSVRMMPNVDFIGNNKQPVKGDLALVSAGNSGTFSSIQIYDVSNPGNPTFRSNSMVSVPLDVVQDSAKLLVMPTSSLVMDSNQMLTGVSGSLLSSREAIGTKGLSSPGRSIVGGLNLNWEVRDYFTANINGIPKTTAYPWKVVTDKHSTAYFINQGIGLMTIDLTKAIPQGTPKTRGERFGPSYIPRDKAGAIVVRDDGTLKKTSSQFSISNPAHLETVNGRVDVSGVIKDKAVAEMWVNGFKAVITGSGKGDEGQTFLLKNLPLNEGANELRATAFASNGSELGRVSQLVIREYSRNPLAGPGSVTLGLPALSIVKSGSIKVSAGVKNAGQFDEIWINGQIVAYCGKTVKHMRRTSKDRTARTGKVCEGVGEIPLRVGVNTVVATAINLDEEFPRPYSAADLWVEEGLVLAVKNDLDIFDSTGLVRINHVPIGTDEQPGKAMRVSVARGIMVDLDNDGKSAIEENEDADDITVFDELRNLALLGEVTAKRLTFVDITEPHKAKVLGRMPTDHQIFSAVSISSEGIAYVAADDVLLTVDLTRANHDGLLDQDGDGKDDRILNTLLIKGRGAQDIRLDREKGLLYVLQRDMGVLIFRRSDACSRDYGVDVTQIPVKREVRFATQDMERTRLLKGLLEGMKSQQCAGKGFKLNTNSALLSQGSSACIWSDDGQCSTAYQPGLSDYDFEFIVPYERIKEANVCAIAMEDAIHDQPGLESADVSVFPVRDIALKTAYRDVQPVAGDSCGGGDDIYGDLCLGRNGNILKWILEGEWVRSQDEIYNNNYDLDEILKTLQRPVYPPKENKTEFYSERIDLTTGERVPILSLGADIEPTHVPRLEGMEWACLEDFSLNQSGARIRIKGVGLGDVPVRSPVYLKKIHKVAKAGMRTIYGLMLSTRTGNKHMLGSTRSEYQSDRGCMTRVKKTAKKKVALDDFLFKRCESFTEYIASRALLSAKMGLVGKDGKQLLTKQQALLGYRMFAHKADVGPQIATEKAANEFIMKVMNFIEEVNPSQDTGSPSFVEQVYLATVDDFTDGGERKTRLKKCQDEFLPHYKPELGASKLKLKIPARLYNSSYVPAAGVNLAFYHDDRELARMSCDLQPGESHFLTKKGKLPENCVDLDPRLQKVLSPEEKKALEKLPVFEIKPKITGVHSVQFMVDPDDQYSEYDKSNNYDGFYYYLLYPKGDGQPLKAAKDKPPPPKPLPNPAASAACLIEGRAPPSPRLQLISLANKQHETAVAPGDKVRLDWIVHNVGNEDLKDIVVEDSKLGVIKFPNLAAGEDKTLDRNLKINEDRDRPVIGISTVRGSDAGDNSVGPVSSVVKINVVPPSHGNPIVRIYSPPKQKPPFETQADSMPVWGYVESDEPLAWVMIDNTPLKVEKEKKGLYRFETESRKKYITLGKGKISTIEVIAQTTSNKKGRDKVEVARKTTGEEVAGKTDTVLRVVKRVSTPKLDGWHERVKAKPGDQLDYKILTTNVGRSDLTQVTISDLDLIQPYMEDKKQVKDAAGNLLYVLDLPPTAPVDLKSGATKQTNLSFKLPPDVGGGRIANRFYAAGVDSAGRPVAGSDQAEVLIDAPAVKGDPDGGLTLDPGIILLRKPSADPKKPTKPEHITEQLKVVRVMDGKDVAASSETRYEEVGQILNPLTGVGKNPLVDVLWKKLKGFLSDKIQQKLDEETKDKTAGLFKLKVPKTASIKFGPDGKMIASGEGINIIRAVHKLPDGTEVYSNYSLVIVGIGNVESIDIQPRSFASFGPQAAQYLTNLLAKKVGGDEDYNLLEMDIPMFLVAPRSENWDGTQDQLSAELANWLGSTGFAELTSVRLDFMGGAIAGVDILEAARYLLKLIPPVTVVVPTPLGPVPVPVPVGWFLAQLVGPAATQMVDFEATGGAVKVRSSFPKGFVSAQEPGLARVTGTLDFSESGFGMAKDDFLAFVGPQLLSTELRPVETVDYPQLNKGSREADIIVAGQKKGTTTLKLEIWEQDRKSTQSRVKKIDSVSLMVEVIDPPANPMDALPPIIVDPIANKKVLIPRGGPRRLRVTLLPDNAAEDFDVHVTEGDRQILSWARASEITIKSGGKGKVLSFARIGQKEKKSMAGKSKPEHKPEQKLIGIGLPNNADLANYIGGGHMDTYIASLLPGVSAKTISNYRKQGVQKLASGCPWTGDQSFSMLEDRPSLGLDNISLDAKLAIVGGKDNSECTLVLKSYALGFPAPNFFNKHKFDEPFMGRNYLLNDQGEPDKDTALFVDNKGTALRILDMAAMMPLVSVKPSSGVTGLTFDREIIGKALGSVHAGVETGAAILGDRKSDTYEPFEGMGGLTVTVVKSDEKSKRPPHCENQYLFTLLDKPLSITLQGASRSRSESDGMAELDIKILNQPKWGVLSERKRKDRSAFDITYTPNASGMDRFHFENDRFRFEVVEGELKSKECMVNVMVLNIPKIKLPPVNFEMPRPFCLPIYVKTEKNKPVDVTLLGFTLRSRFPGLNFSELTFDEFKPKGQVLKELLDYFGYDKQQPLPFKGSVKGFSKKSRIGITSVRYIPDKDAFGLDMFYYKVDDGIKESYYCPVVVDVFDTSIDESPKAIDKTHDCSAQNAPVKSLFGGTDPEAQKLDIKITHEEKSTRRKIIEMGPLLHSHKHTRREFTYMPEKNFSGVDDITYRVTDPEKNWDEGFISFNVNEPPVCTEIIDGIAIEEDEVRSISIFMDDPDNCGDRLQPKLRRSPAKGVITAISKDAISYQPVKDAAAGTDSFTYVAYDGLNESEPCLVTVTLAGPNKPPKAIGQAVVVHKNSGHSDPRNSITLSADDEPIQKLEFNFPAASSQGGSVHGAQRLGPHAMLVTYAPPVDYSGMDSFSFIADDGKKKSKPADISIRVNAPPVAKPDYATTNEGVSVVIKVLENDKDADGKIIKLDSFDPIAYAGDSTPAADVSRKGNSLKVSPRPHYFGQFSFTYQLMDSDGARAEQPGLVTVTVVHVNHPPKARNDKVRTKEDVPVYIEVLANDTDPDKGDEIYIDQMTRAVHGRVTNEGGKVLYLPESNWSGNDRFGYTIRDQDGEESSAKVAIKVTAVNDPPLIPDQKYFLQCCDLTTLKVLKDATDPDSAINPKSLKITQAAHEGKALVRLKQGDITFEPDLAYRGKTEMKVTVSDVQGATSHPAKITLTIGAISGMINEIVPAESKIELYNASGKTLDIKGWTIAGYTIGSQPGREMYSRPPKKKEVEPATRFLLNSHLVLSLPDTDLQFGRIELRDAGGRLREVIEPDRLCYEHAHTGKRALVRRWDGFGANDACVEFHWVNKTSLGSSN